MSVKVGFLNDKYTYDNLNTKNNILRLNSFNDSNIIHLNHDLNSTKDVFLNFKDVISSGFSSNTYCFRDIPGDNSNIMTLNSCNISLDKPVFIQEELYISDVFSTSNGTIKLTSNTEIHLMSPIDSFSVFSSNDVSKILFQTNDFAVNDVDNTGRIQITNNQIDINSNVYISNGTLFVDKISSIGASLNIENASYTSTEFESLISVNSFDLKNSPDSTDKEAFTIYKNYGDANVVSINTCNILESTVTNNFTINNNGLIGVGTETPTASIDIRNVNDNIMVYDGERTGDLFKITREGDIGIGTSLPKAQLHIKRNDDSIHPDNDDNRRNPLLLCDIAYDDSLNTSNVYVSVERQLIYTQASVKQTNMKLYLYNSVVQNDDIIQGGKSVTLTYYLLNDDILNEAVDVPDENKLSAVIDQNYLRFNGNFQEFQTESGYTVNGLSVKIKSIIKYPSNYLSGLTAAQIQFTLDTASQSADTFTITTHMTINHYASDNDYGSEFHLHEAGFEIQVQDGVNLILQYTAQIHNEVVLYNVEYDVINNVQIPCPNFMHMLYNDTFISSLSASGALSLGEEMPVLSNHLLYVKGSSLIDELEVKNIYTNDVTCNISFLNTNLTNINNLQCTLCDSHEILAHAISNVFDIYSSNGVFSNLTASNFTFEHCKNNFLSFAEENIHLNTQVIIGDVPTPGLTNYNNEIQINVSDRVDASYFIQDNLFSRNIGMSVSSLFAGRNPCISVSSFNADAIPSININNSERSYNFRIKKNNDETRFQLTSDNVNNPLYYDSLGGTSETLVPSIIQHTFSTKDIDYSILTFGEQNIMNIDCKNKAEYNFNGANSFQYNNHSSKITMGIPYAKTTVSDKNFVSDIFASSEIQNREYLLNVFGNVSISDICDYPMLTMKSSEIVVDDTKPQRDRQIYVAINGEPDNSHNLCVHGDIACDTIYVKNKDGNLIDLIDTIKTSVDWDTFQGHFKVT
jgi:hypothetical protein